MPSLRDTVRWWPKVLAPLTFFLLGLPFLGCPGIQNDEAIFAEPLFQHGADIYYVHAFHHWFRAMLLPYLGTLKTCIFLPVLLVSTSYIGIRLPALLIGTSTVYLFYCLLNAAYGRRAALTGSILLATDSVSLLTTCFDWGPVVLQHFLLVAGMLLALRFYQTGVRWRLFLAFLCFGVAFWDKALFFWIFGGVCLGTLIAFPRAIWRSLSVRNVAVAALGLILGASPLILYNRQHDFATFESTSSFAFVDPVVKTHLLHVTWNGAVLFGYLTRNDDAPSPRGPQTAIERLSFGVRSATGDRLANRLKDPAVVLAVLLIPFLWKTRARPALVMCAIAIPVAFSQILITKGVGSAHHAILLWPIPYLLIGVSFAEASLRLKRIGTWLLAGVILCICTLDVLLTNQYFYEFTRNGAAGSWSDAMFPLSAGVGAMSADLLVSADWGILPSVQLLETHHRPSRFVSVPLFPPNQSQAERNDVIGLLANDKVLFLGHTDGNEQFPGVNAGLLEGARSAGFEKQVLRTFTDRNGRPIFEAFRFVRGK